MNSRSLTYLPTTVPLPIPEEELLDLVNKGKDWALMHGAAMRSKKNFSADSLNFAPFSLLPSTMTRKNFQHAVELQTIFQELMHKVAYDKEFLTRCLKNTVLVDEFTAKLWQIYETVQKEGETQPISLGLVRCDYMLQSCNAEEKETPTETNENPPCNWKLVEVNTIAAGFGWLGPASRLIQRYIMEEMNLHDRLQNLPDNNALSGLCEGMLEAWRLYANPKAFILIVVEDVSYNICDQRFHQFRIRELNPNANVMRKNLTQIYNEATLNENKELVINNQIVSVVYFRSGYEPCQYHGDNEWEARLLIERSRAIKCPNIQYHLAGCKKVQQELAKPGVLESFITDKDSIKAIKDVYVGIHGLEFDECGEHAINLALTNPEKYVLKPQREGGGNNIYGIEIKEYINKMKDSQERTAWILMERIFPPITKGYIVRPGEPVPPTISEVVSEFGMYGVIIGDSKKIISNRQVGHMLRTKTATANEGGVASGLGALDSPYLID
ncbi:unnamed protein product [Psylliodes chrysocephalus]|uniref:Glutathione synthetase n=1 Tax=Psylliodes chrysocephalus TaxID=3402493 RepID=A0A9P0CU74_9CUCU|nr:unnamed protein product [Psylliodes chrysocephala]